MSKFLDNPTRLGLAYQAFTEKENGDGSMTVRYVLEDKLSPEKLEELKKYENIKVSQNGASRPYAPELKYDVIFITTSEEDDEFETAEESFENEHLGDTDYSNFIDEEEILGQLDREVELTPQPKDSQYRYSLISSAISLENDSIIFYENMKVQFPEYTQLLDDIKEEELKHIGQLQALLMDDPEVASGINKGREEGQKQMGEGQSIPKDSNEAFSEGFFDGYDSGDDDYDTPEVRKLKDLVIEKIENHPLFDEELKEELISDIRVEDILELMGLDVNVDDEYSDEAQGLANEKADKVFSSEANMREAVDEYLAKLEENLLNN